MEILEDLVIPCIVKDHNSKTAIVVRSGRKYIHIIPMKSGKLTVKRLTPAQFIKQHYIVLDIPIQTALSQYMLHSGGYTETARLELEKLT